MRRRSLAVLAVLALALAACGDADDGTEVVAPGGDPTEAVEEDLTDGPATGTAGDDAVDDGPEPDAGAVADPCADHQGREDEAFIDLVAPVQDQEVGDELTLVGCSNVYEATVSWRVLDGDGRTLDEGFTTAECGSGCVGAFEETITLDATATGEPFLAVQVFWEDAADGSDRDLVEVGVVTG